MTFTSYSFPLSSPTFQCPPTLLFLVITHNEVPCHLSLGLPVLIPQTWHFLPLTRHLHSSGHDSNVTCRSILVLQTDFSNIWTNISIGAQQSFCCFVSIMSKVCSLPKMDIFLFARSWGINIAFYAPTN